MGEVGASQNMAGYPTVAAMNTAISNAVAALVVPTAATADPLPVAVSSALGGVSTQFARADHTHASRVRRARLMTATDGTLTWTFSTPFDVGVVPQIQAIVETAVGVTDVLNVQIEGTPTNTQAVLRVTRTQRSVVALIGLTVLSIPTSPGQQWLHLSAFG